MAKNARETRNKELVRWWRASGDFAVLSLLIDNNRRLIESVTASHGIHDKCERLSVAYEALSKALLSVDVDKGSFFEWYRGYLRNAANGRRDEDWIRIIKGKTSAFDKSLLRIEFQHESAMDDDPDDLRERIERESRIDSVKEAVRNASEEDRALVALRFDQGLSYVKIGRRIGTSTTTARRHILAVINRLKKTLSLTLGINPEQL